MSDTNNYLRDIKERKKNGEYYTPVPFVNISHQYIDKLLTPEWINNYTVWEPSYGHGNLTKSLKFKNLYCSTLYQNDIDYTNEHNINPEAIKFQFDFLNDPIDKIPQTLLNDLTNNKPFIFYLNPPYGTPQTLTSGGFMTGATMDLKKDTHSVIREEMKRYKYGICSLDLMDQFIYRLIKIKRMFKLTNCYIFIFVGGGFIITAAHSKLRNLLLNNFNYLNGFVFPMRAFDNIDSTMCNVMFLMFKSKNEELIYL